MNTRSSPRSISTVHFASGVGPGSADDAMAVADAAVDAVVARDLADVVQDRRTVGDGLGVLPWAEPVAERVHVGI